MKKFFVMIGLMLGVVATPLALPGEAMAVNVFDQACSGSNANSPVCADTGKGKKTLDVVIDLLFYVIGIIAVVVIIIGGIKFITADGDPNKIKGARETVMYAVVGLAVAILAYAIVGFVIGRLG